MTRWNLVNTYSYIAMISIGLALTISANNGTLKNKNGEKKNQDFQKGNHAGNLATHLRTHHEEVYDKIKKLIEEAEAAKGEKRKSQDESNSSDDKIKKKTTMTDHFPVIHKKYPIKIRTSFDEIKNAVIELTTVNGLPIRIVESSGMKKLLNLLLDPLRTITKQNCIINRKNLPALIQNQVSSKIEELKQKMKGQLVHLKLDCCTRLGRYFLGINVQFNYENRVELHTMKLLELKDRHTGENLKKHILDVLTEYELTVNNIASIATDNGANVLKSVLLLNTILDRRITDSVEETETESRNLTEDNDMEPVPEPSNANQNDINSLSISNHEDEDDDDDQSFTLDSVEELEIQYEDELSINNGEVEPVKQTNRSESDNDNQAQEDENAQWKKMFENSELFVEDVNDSLVFNVDTLENYSVQSTRCAAHTLQLVLSDVMSGDEKLMAFIDSVRSIIKTLRTQKFTALMKDFQYKKFKLDCDTRWMSVHDMLSTLVANKDTVSKIGAVANEVFVSENSWKKISKIIDALNPLKVATTQLQKADLRMDEFFVIWVTTKARLKKNGSKLAMKLHEKMNAREEKLLTNSMIFLSIYLNPALKNFLVNKNQSPDFVLKTKSENALEVLLKRLIQLSKDPNDGHNADLVNDSVPAPDPKCVNEDMTDEIDEFINSDLAIPSGSTHNTETQQQLLTSLKQEMSIYFDTRYDVQLRTLNTYDWWKKNKLKFPQLYNISRVVLSAPPTQVSVERLFSQLKYVLSEHRNRTGSQLLNNILFLRVNKY